MFKLLSPGNAPASAAGTDPGGATSEAKKKQAAVQARSEAQQAAVVKAAAVAGKAKKAAAAPKKPAEKTAVRQVTRNPYIGQYAELVAAGDYELVESILRRHLADSPLDAEATALLARCRLRLNDHAEAARLFAEAEALGGYVRDDRRDWAEALDGMGRSDEARGLLMSAIRLNPTSWQLYWDYAGLVDAQDHYDALRLHCQDLRTTKPLSDAIERALAKAATLVDDFDTANGIYRRLIAIELKNLSEALVKTPGVYMPKIDKEKSNDLAGGKGETCLKDFKAALEPAGVPFFLMAGTVLGYIRDGRLLEGDKDVDVGIFEADYDRPRIEDILRSSGQFQIKRVDDHADRIRAVHRNGVWIDVFPYFTEGHRTWHAGTVARWWHEPFELAPYVVDGTSFMIPADTDAYLEENYGPDWRIPYSLFDVYNDAPNAEIMRYDYLRHSTWRKTFEGLKVRDWEKVHKYLTKDPGLIAENPWLIRLRLTAEQQMRLRPVEE